LKTAVGWLGEGGTRSVGAMLYYFDQVFTDLENFGQNKFERNQIIQKKKILGEAIFWL
jgi:hypothetical protein